MIVTLSRPAFAAVAENDAQHSAGIFFDGCGSPAGAHHLRCPGQKFLCVQPHHRGGNHAEVRQGGVTSADRGPPEENMQKAIRLRHLLHLRSRIGDRDELAAGFRRAHGLLGALEKILLENVGFERAARLAGNDEERLRNINQMLERFHLGGIGRIEHVQGREVRGPAERHAQNFRAQARSAHPEQQHMLKAAGLHFLRELRQLIVLRDLLIDDIEPAQPVGFVAAGPERGIALPQTLHLAARLPIGDRGFHSRGQRFRQGSLQLAHKIYPFCCVFFSVLLATAARSLSNASANNLTPSSVSLSVTCLIEMPARARSSITLAAPATSSVRALRSRP